MAAYYGGRLNFTEEQFEAVLDALNLLASKNCPLVVGHAKVEGGQAALPLAFKCQGKKKGLVLGGDCPTIEEVEEVFKGATLETRPINPNVKDKASLEIARELELAKECRAISMSEITPENEVFSKPFSRLTGMEEQVRRAVECMRAAQAYGRDAVCLHTMLLGNPGSGKTTFARELHEFGRAEKVLDGEFVEARADDLVARYVGHTAGLVRAAWHRARGGTLFIDEAYKLADTAEFGLEAINALVELMEAGRGEVVVVAAGYPAQMSRFLEVNPGLTSRFSLRLNFDDYDAKTLEHILVDVFAPERHVTVAEDARERLSRILEMTANDRVDREACSAGDIVAAVGFKNTTTGDTLADEQHPIILESIEFADPVIDVAVEPKTKAEQDKMSVGLAKLAEEDPTFQVHTDHETGQTIIAGMGELHLEIIIDRLRREFKVDCNVGKPQVAYRETAGHAVKGVQGKFVRQSGGRGQYGDAVIDLEPMEPGFGYEFVDATVGGSVPKEYIPSVDKGIQEALNSGVIAGYPVQDIKVTLVDGSYHEVDSSEAAFKVAGSMAIKKALQESDPVLLEPVEKVEVETPEQYMGDVMGNLSSRRGKIEGMEDRSNTKVIRAKVPLGEMFGYATDLRSQTQGRASYTMQFDAYEPVPKAVRDEIVSKNGGKES